MADHDPFPFFPYQAIVDRPPMRWPNGARVAVWVIPNIEHFHIEIGASAPDIRNWSPDSTAFVFAKNYNLFIVEKAKGHLPKAA